MYLELINENYTHLKKEIVDEASVGYEDAYSIVHEVYYGKTDEIKAIEKKIGEIREKYRSSPMKANTSKEKEELEDLFCNAFGFTCCSFHIDPSNLYNACTVPISSSVFDFRDLRNHVESKNGKGLKYKKSANIYLVFEATKGLMFSSQFTDAEVTAIILHEVGHNFQTSMSGKCHYMNMVQKTLEIIAAPIIMLLYPQAGPLRNVYTDIIKKIEKDYKGLADCYWFISNIFKTVISYGVGYLVLLSNIGMMFNPLLVIKQIPQQILQSLNIDFILGGFRNEAVADAFVSAYGYSADLATGLSKIEKSSGGMVPNQVFRDMGFIGMYFDLLNMPTKIITNCFDPHPNTISRMKSQYDYIEKEMLKKETNPKMKKELEKQLRDIKKSIDKFVDAEDDGFFFSNKMDSWMLLTFGGDIRNGLGKGIPEEFDQAQERSERQLQIIKSKK